MRAYGPNGVRLLQFFLNLILTFDSKVDIILVMNYAWMAKLADAQDLKSWELRFVRVQVPLCALVILREMTPKIMQTHIVGQQALAVRKLSCFITLTLW